jgi:hypothetical protein
MRLSSRVSVRVFACLGVSKCPCVRVHICCKPSMYVYAWLSAEVPESECAKVPRTCVHMRCVDGHICGCEDVGLNTPLKCLCEPMRSSSFWNVHEWKETCIFVHVGQI